MAQNNFWVDLVASLKKTQSKKQIQSDAKNLGDIKVPLIGTLSKAKTKAQLKQDLASLNGTINLTGKVNKKGIVTSVQQATTQAQAQANKAPIQVSMNLKKDKLINDIKIFGQQNTKLFKDANMTAKYNSLLDNAKLATSAKQIQDLRMQLSAMRSEIKATNLSGLTLGDTFKKTFKRATELFTGTGGVMLLSQQLRKAWTEALSLDKAYTDLIKVQSELTRGDYPEYLERCNKKAQELATTQQALIESTTEFSKSGYNLTDSNALAEQATVLSNVGDMSASDSAKAIISGVQAYDVIDGYEDVEKKAEALIDKYNEIGNTASITTAEIAQGVQSVGSVFADANTSVDEFIALLAAGNRQYQDADALALGLRTSALRIRGCTAELQEMGEETEGVITSTSKLEAKIKALTNINGSGGVEILEADGETFRSIYDIYVDIAKVYKDMSDTDQSALLELIAGKHRASAISATLNNMSEAQEIYQRSLESAGSAQEEYDKYLQSSEAALNRFKSSMTETYQSVISGETVTGLLNSGNAALQFANDLGLVESTLKGFLVVGVIKTITTLSTAFKASAIQASNFGTALKTADNMSKMTRGTAEYTKALNKLKTVSVGLSEARLKQVLANKSLSNSDRVAILQTTGLTKVQSQAKLAQLGLTQSTKAQTVAQNSATVSTFSLSTAVRSLGVSLKVAFMTNPIGITIMALSTAIGLVTSAVDFANQKSEEAKQKIADLRSELQETTSELESVESELKNINSQIDEILSKDTITLTDENDLKRLQLENEELERRKKLLELQQQAESKELNEAAEDEYKKKFQSKSVSVWIPEDERINTVNPNQTVATKSVTQEEKFAYNLKLAKELASYEGKITEEQAKKYEELQTYFLEQADSLSNIKDGYNAITPEQQEQLKIWNQMIDDAIWVSENFPGSAKNVTSRLMDKFAGGFNRNDGSTYLSTTDTDKQIATWIESLSDDEKKILLTCDIEDASLDDLQDYLSEQKEIIEEESTIEVGLTFSYDKLEDIPQKLTEIENAYNTAKSAMEEYNAQGYYSMETIDSLLALEDQYVNTLIDENGQVLINTDTMNMLSIQKIEAAKASIYQEACEELVRIKTLDTALAAQELALINGTLTESAYETARALHEEVVAMGGANAALGNKVWETTTKKVKLLDNQIGHLKNGTYDLGKSTKDTANSAKSHIESYMNLQKLSLEKGQIDYNTYCNTVSNLLKKMFKDGKISAQDYHTYTKEMLSVQKDIYDKALSAITNLFDKEIEKQEDIIENIEKQNELLEKQMTQMENAADAVIDYYDSLIDAENDAIKGIEDHINGYDALISVSDRLYESEQQALDAQKDAIAERIKGIQDATDAVNLQLKKEQALDELYKARNQRTKYIYTGEGKGFIYQTDTDAIRDAQQNVKDIETELIISQLEKEQKALDESIDALQKYRDAINDIADAHKRFEEESIVSNLLGSDYASIILGTNLSDWGKLKDVYISSNEEIKNHEDTIARLEEAKDQWTDLSNVIDTQVKEQAASEQFGADWKKQIQEGTLISFEEYKEMYLDIQSQINDNNSTIESIEEKIAYYETLKENYSSITTVYEEEEAKRYAAMLLGQGWENDVLDGRLETLNNFRDNYVSLQEEIANAAWESANAQIEAYKKVQDETGGDEPPENVAVHVKEELISSKNVIFQKYAKGTKHAKKGLNLVGEEGVETYIDNNGNVSLVTEPTLIPMEGGETVKNASETKSMLNPDNLVSLKSILSGEVPTVLKRESDVLLTKAPWTNMEKMLTPIDYSHMFKNLNTSLPQNVVQKRDTVVNQNININCPNVTNNSGAEYLQRELQKAQLMAYQRSYRN